MTEGHARVARIADGMGHFAEVRLSVGKTSTPERSRVQLFCTGQGFVGQGDLEEVPSEGLQDWKTGAETGARVALRYSGLSADVAVDAISNLSTDTNEWTVAEATANAVWSALGLNVDPQVLSRLEALVHRSWREDALQIANLDSLLPEQLN